MYITIVLALYCISDGRDSATNLQKAIIRDDVELSAG